MAFSAFFQREETGEAGRAAADPIDGREVAESGVERTIDRSCGLQGDLERSSSQSLDKAGHFAECTWKAPIFHGQRCALISRLHQFRDMFAALSLVNEIAEDLISN